MRDSISFSMGIHHISAEDYAKLDFPEEERNGTRWKTFTTKEQLVRIVFFKPHEGGEMTKEKFEAQAGHILVTCPDAGKCVDGKTCLHAKPHEHDHRAYSCNGNDRIACPPCRPKEGDILGKIKAMCQGSEFDCQEAEMRTPSRNPGLASYYRGRAGAFGSILSLIRELER